MLIFLIAVMVMLPAIFLIFYCLKSVRATCKASRAAAPENASAERPATTRPPVPLLILGVWESITALSVFVCLFFRVTVFFGMVLEGLAAVLYFLTYSLFSAFAAWLIFRRKLLGWQIAIAKTGIMALSALVICFHAPDWALLYRKMGFDDQILSFYNQFP